MVRLWMLSVLLFALCLSTASTQDSPFGGSRNKTEGDESRRPPRRIGGKRKAALNRALTYVKNNYRKRESWRSGITRHFFAGFLFLMDESGQFSGDLQKCVDYCVGAMDQSSSNTNQNWYLGMCMYFLAEYSLKHPGNPKVMKKLRWAAGQAAKNQEPGGGWCHRPGFAEETGYHKQGGAIDLGILTAMIYSALHEMESLGIDCAPTRKKARKNLQSIFDGHGFGYGSPRKPYDVTNGRGAYALLGLLVTDQKSDPWVPKIVAGIEKRHTKARKGHGFAALHYFSLGAAMHRLGPSYFRRFADHHFDKLIAKQEKDGSILLGSDGRDKALMPDRCAETAAFACLLMMERDGVFRPKAKKKGGGEGNPFGRKGKKD